MIPETKEQYTVQSKTGWTRADNRDLGWWAGYVERKNNVYFFATRLIKPRQQAKPDFGQCRKGITLQVLKELHALD